MPRDEAIDLARFTALAAAGDLAQLRAEWAAHPLMQTRSPEAAALVAEILADYDARDLLAPSAMPGFPREVLASLMMPVLSMTGADDTPWRRACARAFAAIAPRARHLELPGAGHLANLDNPGAFNDALAGFSHTGVLS